jgi:ABC-type proline/glycine betaine transport system permease subunit
MKKDNIKNHYKQFFRLIKKVYDNLKNILFNLLALVAVSIVAYTFIWQALKGVDTQKYSVVAVSCVALLCILTLLAGKINRLAKKLRGKNNV